MIQRFRQLHLSQQSLERQYLDVRKNKALEKDDFGHPYRALLFPDGMTQFTCLTPRFKKVSKGDKVIESRIVGIEVYCGPIKTVFVYRTGAMVGGGANIMIELMRQAMIDLCELLRKNAMKTPRTMWFQFDNCGENKNKEVFAYISLLIESFIFDEVEVCFLIVGHTHASIDQYFSVISNAIKSAYFIGTPIALLELIRQTHNNNKAWQQEAVIRDITVYFDMKEALAPYINKKIKYYQIPHCFRFKIGFGRCAIMQYKMFSGNQQYLPAMPTVNLNTGEEMRALSVDTVTLPNKLAVVDGRNEVISYFGLGGRSSSRGIINSAEVMNVDDLLGSNKLNSVTDLNSMLPDLEALSYQSITQQQQRMDDEADGVEVKKRYQHRSDIQKEMIAMGNSKEGYIIWLNLVARKEGILPIDQLTPRPFKPEAALLQAINEGDNEVETPVGVDEPPRTAPMNNREGGGSSSAPNTDAAHKKQFTNAKNIAASCRWILNQAESSRLILTRSRKFEKFHFNTCQINDIELEWLTSNDTTAKVLRNCCSEYDAAASWEPLPTVSLSIEDLARIANEQEKHRQAIEQANIIASQLLVRVGHNAPEDQQILEYGVGNIEYIAAALRKKRSPAPGSANAASKKARKEKGLILYKCDIAECVESAPATLKLCSERGCGKYRYCQVLHLAHMSHSMHIKRKKRERFGTTEAAAAEAAAVQQPAVSFITSSNNEAPKLPDDAIETCSDKFDDSENSAVHSDDDDDDDSELNDNDFNAATPTANANTPNPTMTATTLRRADTVTASANTTTAAMPSSTTRVIALRKLEYKSSAATDILVTGTGSSSIAVTNSNGTIDFQSSNVSALRSQTNMPAEVAPVKKVLAATNSSSAIIAVQAALQSIDVVPTAVTSSSTANVVLVEKATICSSLTFVNKSTATQSTASQSTDIATTSSYTPVDNVVMEKDIWSKLSPSAAKLHKLISTAVEHERQKAKGRDYMYRLSRDLSFPMYIKDLVFLSSSEYYNIPLTTVTNSQDAITTGSSYKPIVANKSAFYLEFCTRYIVKYCS